MAEAAEKQALEHELDDPETRVRIQGELSAIAKEYRGDTNWKDIEEPGAKCKAVSHAHCVFDYLDGPHIPPNDCFRLRNSA